MSKILYAIVAPSRCGKDSLAVELSNYYDHCRFIKWAAFVKRTVESAYGLPSYSLETDETRLAIDPETGKTYLQILVDFYHCQDALPDPYFWKRKPIALFNKAMSDGNVVFSTDTRSTWEVNKLIELVAKYQYKLVAIKLTKENQQPLSSDKLLDVNFELLKTAANISIERTLPECEAYVKNLENLAKEIYNEVNKDV